jgi:hypothetical protein
MFMNYIQGDRKFLKFHIDLRDVSPAGYVGGIDPILQFPSYLHHHLSGN